ncbi:hypothetical protein Sjap_024142 [Stephania japonica]|uniref:Uncharacterized protein n=1 Tax=Stephania japonica TaxID=461633 RepID=A0AAP0EF00_9MAGN
MAPLGKAPFKCRGSTRAVLEKSTTGLICKAEYALEAVRKGNVVVGVRGTDTIVLGVEKKSIAKLQNSRSYVVLAVIQLLNSRSLTTRLMFNYFEMLYLLFCLVLLT